MIHGWHILSEDTWRETYHSMLNRQIPLEKFCTRIQILRLDLGFLIKFHWSSNLFLQNQTKPTAQCLLPISLAMPDNEWKHILIKLFKCTWHFMLFQNIQIKDLQRASEDLAMAGIALIQAEIFTQGSNSSCATLKCFPRCPKMNYQNGCKPSDNSCNYFCSTTFWVKMKPI